MAKRKRRTATVKRGETAPTPVATAHVDFGPKHENRPEAGAPPMTGGTADVTPGAISARPAPMPAGSMSVLERRSGWTPMLSANSAVTPSAGAPVDAAWDVPSPAQPTGLMQAALEGSFIGAPSAPPPQGMVGENLAAPSPVMNLAPTATHGAAEGFIGGETPRDDLDNAPLLFEIAWEVCWQLGGIYTVLRTKAPAMMARWGGRYCLIGPYNPRTAALEFEPRQPHGAIARALRQMREAGIECHFGRWLIDGNPPVILVDHRHLFRALDANKYLLWKDHGIATPPNDGEINEVISFGFAVAEFFRMLTATGLTRPVLAHFHEWMAGVAVPRIAAMGLGIATVFTTHATLLGRYLAGDDPDFYRHLATIDADAQAARLGIEARHKIEKTAAHACGVFTTVSEVTAAETHRLLGRRPQAILPNGLNIQRFAALHEFQNLHRHYKERIHEFVMGHFFPSYTFDLERTLYLFTSGRYEYRNKGMDLFIEAMFVLNQRLKEMRDPPTVVAFIITRAATRNINVSVLQNQIMFHDLQNTCVSLQREMGRKLFSEAAHGRLPHGEELISPEAQVRLKRAVHAWRNPGATGPAVVTHDLDNDAADPIMQHLRHRGLTNAADDPVKIVFHPEFATATSPLLRLDYEHFVRGCHMGIFPSYYEPWGYTPMECAALGLPAVTTDLSGFGAFVQSNVSDYAEQGIDVLARRDRSFLQACDELGERLVKFVQLDRRQRIELRNRVERLGEMFDWSQLIKYYDAAHAMALEKIQVR